MKQIFDAKRSSTSGEITVMEETFETSRKWRSNPLQFVFSGTLYFHSLPGPEVSEIRDGHILAEHPQIFDLERKDKPWKQMPHVALANLRTLDKEGKVVFRPKVAVAFNSADRREVLSNWADARAALQIERKAAQNFVRDYGGFTEAYKHGPFDQPIENIARRQDCLRRQWLPDELHILQPLIPRLNESEDAFENFRPAAEQPWIIRQTDAAFPTLGEGPGGDDTGFEITVFQDQEFPFSVSTHDLWTFIRYLCIRDAAAGKTGFCANPECPAPYFIKSRRTQKFCELGPCTEWAHRQHSLKWWRREGEERRQAVKRRRKGKRSR